MNDAPEEPLLLWRKIVASLERETAELPISERDWLQERLEAIATLQERMHALFLDSDGARICRECGGDCCDRGKNHVTLANLLQFHLAGETPPEPDFSLACPYGGSQGCLYLPGRRPFTCVSFLCDKVEETFPPGMLDTFYALEKKLRRLYLELDERYAGSSLRGIFIRAPRLQGRPFLAPA